MKNIVLLLLALISANSWSRMSDDNLTLKLSKDRKAQVGSVAYDLFFQVDTESDLFSGITKIKLKLNHLKSPLTIDSMVTKVESVKVNGVQLENFPIRKGSFDIPKKSLAKEMLIEISYSSEFSQESKGFKKAVDPQDKETYLYTDFEPYHAHWLFPCLDQPDLKATYTIEVKSPKYWKIISNESIKEERREGDFKFTQFNETKPFSTYLFFLGAGPWAEWNEKYDGLPLEIFTRKSMSKYVDAEKIFDTTKKGLKFFNDYFGYPYPFSKYGQVFVPDFSAGAMENPGAVTFNEQRFLYRGPVSSTLLEDRDNVILHEMAHMWFGDLVTMEWWNDLWLNESFATYAATLAQARGLNSEFADIDFLSTKTWGYWQDLLVTSHPIETAIPDVRAAKGIFDGITYAKGASALKQLHFYVGEEGFRDGLRNYFKKYAYQNTERKDFINSIAEASKLNLDNWTKKWLQSSGPNEVQVSFKCQEGKVAKADIIQKKSVSGALSPHKTRLTTYKKDGDSLLQSGTFDVNYEKAKTEVKELLGKACPDFIFPNYEDKDYAIYKLDPSSLKHASLALTKLPDPLSRYGLWDILLQMVRDQELHPSEFFPMALQGLRDEDNEGVIGILLGRHSSLRNHYFYYLTKEERSKLAPEMEKILWERINTAEKGSSIQISFFEFYVSVAQTVDSQEKIFSMLKSNKLPNGLKMDEDKKWTLIRNLSTNGHPESKKLIVEESKKDVSTIGKRQALAANTAFPEAASKREYLDLLFSHKLPFSDMREAADIFFSVNHPQITDAFLKEFYAKVSKMDWNSNDNLVNLYFARFFPFEACTKKNESMSKKAFKSAKKLTNIAKKGWREAQDELSRCVKVRAMKVGSY